VRRRLDLERPVEPEIIEWAIALALQAPSGSNRQNWRFIVVTDSAKRAAIGRIYREVFEQYGRALREQPNPYPADDPRHGDHSRVMKSAAYLAENFAAVPVHVIAAIEGRVEKLPPISLATLYGSILPAAWSFMLALRARGVGSAWTTIHVAREREIAAVLGIPDGVTQAVLLPVAYFRGATFRRARRIPQRSVTYWEEWGRAR
jgi:nitroreductase